METLSSAVLEQVRRLGGLVSPPVELQVETRRGARALPGALAQWLQVQWPRKLVLTGEIDGRTYRRVALGVGGPLAEYACAEECDYYVIAHLNGGNDYLLVDLDGPGLADPPVWRLAHDSFDGSPWSFDEVERLSQFLSRLQPLR